LHEKVISKGEINLLLWYWVEKLGKVMNWSATIQLNKSRNIFLFYSLAKIDKQHRNKQQLMHSILLFDNSKSLSREHLILLV